MANGRNVASNVNKFKGMSAEQTKRKILADQNGKGDTEDEEVSGHGNTGLPFGLCKKHGISLPENATPRDAWDALKGVGIFPPWTDKGKDQYTDTDSNTGEDNGKEGISAQKQKVFNTINEKLAKFPQEYREKLTQALSNLTDEEVEVFAMTLSRATYVSGTGYFRPAGKTLSLPTGGGGPLDKELGYDFRATTFFHEYGHFLANIVAQDEGLVGYRDFNETPDMQQIFVEDAQALLERVAKESGLTGTPQLSRIKHEYKIAFRDYLDKLTDKKIAQASEPHKPIMHYVEADREDYIAKQMRWYGFTREQAEAAVDDLYRRKTAEYQEEVERYNKKMEEWNSIKDLQKQARAKHERYGFISDFIAGATGGRINPYDYGHWGHSDSYWKGSRSGYVTLPGQKNGVEPWAEFVALKMSKDEKGLAAFKDYLPKTHQKYEEVYSTLKERIKNG